jgi:hypothetical protein
MAVKIKKTIEVELTTEELKDVYYCVSSVVRAWDNLQVDVDPRWDALVNKIGRFAGAVKKLQIGK